MLIVGIGGTLRPGSSSETALRLVLDQVSARGLETECFSADRLQLPLYDPTSDVRSPAAQELVDAVRRADGIVFASPGYHGTVSGLVKNALDYIEDLAKDPHRTYLDETPVGSVAVAYGWQAAANTLGTLREVTHALRGWPTPYGAAINAAGGVFEGSVCTDEAIAESLRRVGDQVADGALANKKAQLAKAQRLVTS